MGVDMRKKRVRNFLFMGLAIGLMGGVYPVISGEQPIAKVRAYRNGKITLNGREVTMEEMRKGFSDLKKKNGVVWYFREAAEQEPHSNATLVVKEIIDAKLPVSMSNKEDFSTVVLQDGTIKPR
jgi:hypothetical protein